MGVDELHGEGYPCWFHRCLHATLTHCGSMRTTQEAMASEDVDRTQCLIRLITLIIGGVAAVLAIAAVTVYARRALKQALVVRSKLAQKIY